jgi:hypothetical protein
MLIIDINMNVSESLFKIGESDMNNADKTQRCFAKKKINA